MAGRALKIDPKVGKTSEPIEPMTSAHEASIRTRAYEIWQARGCPDGSAQEDWFQAEQELIRRG